MKPVDGLPNFTKGLYLLVGNNEQELSEVLLDLVKRVNKEYLLNGQGVYFKHFVGDRMNRQEILEWSTQVQNEGMGPDNDNWPVLASTMHPWVVDSLRIAEDVQERLLFVRDGKLMRLDEVELHDFLRDYRAGICHTSEIMVSNGLW
jgi:hypothetical protein